MSLKNSVSHILLIAFCLWAWILVKETIPFTMLVILSFYLYKRYGYQTVFLFLFLCFVCALPRIPEKPVKMMEAKVVQTGGRYAVLQEGRSRILVYTDSPLFLDSTYRVEKIEEPVCSSGFYRFNSERWMRQLRVSGTADQKNIHLVKEGKSIRSFVQKKIDQSDKRSYLYKILLNVNVQQEESLFFSNGFSYAGILGILEVLLKYKVERKKRNKILICLNILLNLFYRFPFILTASFIFRILSFTHLSKEQRTGLGMCLCMCFSPAHILSLSFLIPMVYRLSFLFKEKKEVCSFLVLCIQALFLHAINPVQSLLYPILKNLLGLYWLMGLLALFLPLSLPVELLENIFRFLDQFNLPSSMAGICMIFYLGMIFPFFQKRHGTVYASILLLIFQMTGLFHPFASISFISVGQGDAILVRAPLNQENILIDTGKPSQWKNLETYLDGEGVKHLKALIITHSDDDHSGNKDNVIAKYEPGYVITKHQQEMCFDTFCLYDLNDIDSEDENESSITSYFQINHLRILLTGDINAYAEERICDRFSHLKCDILKLSHHGSHTGSSERFLDTLQPKLAMISSGAYSIYHHPSPVVIQRLLKRHIRYFDTKEEGDLKILCIGSWHLFVTSSGKVGLIK